jgi:hypothetical protein
LGAEVLIINRCFELALLSMVRKTKVTRNEVQEPLSDDRFYRTIGRFRGKIAFLYIRQPHSAETA